MLLPANFDELRICNISQACAFLCRWLLALHQFWAIERGLRSLNRSIASQQLVVDSRLQLCNQARTVQMVQEERVHQRSLELESKADEVRQISSLTEQLGRLDTHLQALLSVTVPAAQRLGRCQSKALERRRSHSVRWLFCAACLELLGPLPISLRKQCMAAWQARLKPHAPWREVLGPLAERVTIPTMMQPAGLDFVPCLFGAEQVQSWHRAKLPLGQALQQSAAIVYQALAHRAVLILDPDGVGTNWLQATHQFDRHAILSLLDSDFETCLTKEIGNSSVIVVQDVDAVNSLPEHLGQLLSSIAEDASSPLRVYLHANCAQVPMHLVPATVVPVLLEMSHVGMLARLQGAVSRAVGSSTLQQQRRLMDDLANNEALSHELDSRAADLLAASSLDELCEKHELLETLVDHTQSLAVLRQTIVTGALHLAEVVDEAERDQAAAQKLLAVWRAVELIGRRLPCAHTTFQAFYFGLLDQLQSNVVHDSCTSDSESRLHQRSVSIVAPAIAGIWETFLHRLPNDLQPYATCVLASTVSMHHDELWMDDTPAWETVLWQHMVHSGTGSAKWLAANVPQASLNAVVATTPWPKTLSLHHRELCALFVCLSSSIFGQLPHWLADTETPDRVVGLQGWLSNLNHQAPCSHPLPVVVSRLPMPWKLAWLAAFFEPCARPVAKSLLAGSPLTETLGQPRLDLSAFVLKQPSKRPIIACGATASDAVAWARQTAAEQRAGRQPLTVILSNDTLLSALTSLQLAMEQGLWVLLQVAADMPIARAIPLVRGVHSLSRLRSPAFRLWICCAHHQYIPSELQLAGACVSVGVTAHIATYWRTTVTNLCRQEVADAAAARGSTGSSSGLSSTVESTTVDRQPRSGCSQALCLIAGLVAFECERAQTDRAWWINLDRLSELATLVRRLIARASPAQLVDLLYATMAFCPSADDGVKQAWQRTVAQAHNLSKVELNGAVYDIEEMFLLVE